MLITFSTRARYPDITMFGETALYLISLMGKSKTVPGTVDCDEMSEVLNRLRLQLQNEPDESNGSPDEDDEGDDEKVPISVRAVPLVEMLEASLQEHVPIVWQEDRKT